MLRSRTPLRMALVAMLVAGLGLTASAQVYVVPDGAGDEDGSSWANAFGTIQDALDDAAASGADVWVAAGVYVISPSISWPANVAAYGGFPEGGGDWADRDPWTHETVLDRDGSSSMINMHEAGTNVIDGFVLTGEVGGYHGMLNVGDRGATPEVNATVANCIFIDNENRDGAIKVEAESDVTVENCYFINNDNSEMTQGRGPAIHMTHDSTGTVTNCVFIGNQSTDTHNGGSAIFGASGASLTIEYSTFYGNIAPDGASVIRGPFAVNNSIVWGNTPNVISNGAEYTNSIDDVDPLFVDAANNDLSLQSGSPAINAGTEPWPATDIQGTARPQGSAADIGAYEFFIEGEPVTVPEVVFDGEWWSLEDVEAALVDAGLTLGTISQVYSDDVPEGLVMGQDPAAGSEIPEGSAVNLTVSRGPAPTDMPAAGLLALGVLAVLAILGGIAILRRAA